ncbi:hydrogenase maturation protein HypF [Novosphingobium sp. SG751A]|uniref:carbamoyltransferase HypF n=1 Tax=Novosphingobium sp. SG751A TaxID=2587000 RepID=UPI0015572144|nr:carbamoyltransferase HypF [Novosphingobium sp. SG751A]NOW44208.1 hydrogenase maturation protein HypF [Novosphingobium sp. SG751A]
MSAKGRSIRVRGTVQGVGFRPFVWRLARELGLTGEVSNDGQGVRIAAWGDEAELDELARRIRDEAPPLARVAGVEVCDGPNGQGWGAFKIVESGQGATTTAIPPDAATCPACLAEIRDPGERRHKYAFTNCTHCGPRLTIARAIPWDRAQTSMGDFPMCADCAEQYGDPADRRFHAQPIACAACGPRLWIEGAEGEPIAAAVKLLRGGAIVAVKGLGGFHLACDAMNAQAVAELRCRKARDAKPFAVMTTRPADLCEVSAAARTLLESAAAPIVLLPRRAAAPEALAPDQDHLGVMLPATPLHHLLLVEFGGPLVMTSGNRSGEPQVIDNAQAREVLSGIADAFVMHDRAIENRLDDSVLAMDEAGASIPIRRARGFAPAPIALPFDGLPPVLACGGELKATFTLIRGGEAMVGPHIGDLEQAAALGDYRAMLDLYRRLFDFTPAIVAVDAHGGYLSTQMGERIAQETGACLVRVAHHHAHMASCLADNGMGDGEYIGLLLDGLGLGPDGALWGGEVLRGGYRGVERVGGFVPVPLVGGVAAMKEPWRNLLAHLRAAFGADWRAVTGPVMPYLPDEPRLRLAESMIDSGTNCPPCSSAGRLFDAVAAALGIYPARISHEGQAAMALEALARPYDEAAWDIAPDLAWGGLWRALLGDLNAGVAPGRIAARFHATLARVLAHQAAAAGAPGGYVILSGGVMQNRVLLAGLRREIRARGMVPVAHKQVPANDGGLSLGQGIIAALRERGE